MSNFKFEDNTLKVIAELKEQTTCWLYDAAGEVQAQTIRNTRVDTSQLKNSWKYNVDESKGEAQVGSPLENAIWEEYGTGEYAVKGDGRKGYWVYVKGSEKHSKSSKTYSLAEAKRVCSYLRKKGLDAYYTKGKKPNRTLERAFKSSKNTLKMLLENRLKGLG